MMPFVNCRRIPPRTLAVRTNLTPEDLAFLWSVINILIRSESAFKLPLQQFASGSLSESPVDLPPEVQST
jgi:hypothetical protein